MQASAGEADGTDPVKLETKADFEAALARLRRRAPEKLAAFVLSLAAVRQRIAANMRQRPEAERRGSVAAG
jgi:hypothetical protein